MRRRGRAPREAYWQYTALRSGGGAGADGPHGRRRARAAFQQPASLGGLSFRPAAEADIPFAADATSALAAHHPVLADEMKLFWEWSDALGPARRRVVEEGGRAVGYLSVSTEGDKTHGWIELALPTAAPDGWADG